ncbi:MAG TPA: leucyl aminopeptidase family protein [Candidatus Paceibacterota bacterium]|nr:leucyl aminopeptidase family protein [Candidatus Paceibacterota bacterium]
MKILFATDAPTLGTQIRLISGPISRFVEKGDLQELHIGYGDKKPLSQRKITIFLRKIVTTAKENKLGEILLDWAELRKLASKDVEDKKLAEVAAIAFHMADFEFNVYKQEPEGGFAAVNQITIANAPKVVQDGFARGELIAMEVNSCRALSNTPGGDMTPRVLAEAAQAITKGTMVRVDVMGRKEIEQLGMGGVVGIGKGSAEEPKFITMEYRGGAANKKPVVLVGKGVTFDTGGLNIKSGDHMYEMHMDMSGGAAVMHAVALAAKLKLKVNVIGLIPAVENAASGSAVRPGDILRSLSGRTIEILNTDAEGRVILADAITYAKRYDPKIVVDVATLTGAALVALGTQANAFMTNKESLIPTLQELGEESGDYMWPFPAWEEYEEMTKGTFGDVPNISTAGNSRYGGVIAGGMFLREFAKDLDCPWVHIDMAPRMTSTPGEFLAKGAAGAPVRLLLGIIEEYGR